MYVTRLIPYRGKLRRGKVTKFWPSDEYFSPTKNPILKLNFLKKKQADNDIFQWKVTKMD